MNPESQVRNLEQALLARARELVREHLEKAASERERILAEVAQRLRLREEREILAAKADAERIFRRRVQAAEIRMQGELDRLRWTLVQTVLGAVRAELARVVDDESAYPRVLAGYLAAAARHIDGDALVADLNVRDRERFAARWEAFAAEAIPGKRVSLSPTAIEASGGVIVRTPNNDVRVDNTFEGRIDRLEETVQAAILERLFAAVPHMETVFHG
ncbi:MAG: V-type ATP synthase subunit E family protein [Burkholderiales bacterium]|jgi:V/A-type H+-transporting ATPase subunit E|nr:V-type ATP synthase subunit E family protein [Burkholderiales bacterium]